MPDNDLISRADAINAVRHAWAKGLEPSQYIEIIPAVDAAPVIRCKNCWKLGYDNCPMDDYFDIHPMEPDFYCAAGESEEKRPRGECGLDYCDI